MARARNPKREQAKQIWLDSKGEKALKDIADELDLSPSQIRKWKSQDKWSDELKGNVTNDQKERYQSMRSNQNAKGNNGGAPEGNKNAVGNAGGGAPKGNHNALVTGEYETISFDTLTDEERSLFEGVTDDPLITINTQIRELKIRQHRIMQRIERRQLLHDGELEITRTFEMQRGKPVPLGASSKSTTQSDDLLKLESALNAVNGQLLRAVAQKQRILDSLTRERKLLLRAQIDKAEAEAVQLQQINADMGLGEQMQEMSLDELRRLADVDSSESEA